MATLINYGRIIQPFFILFIVLQLCIRLTFIIREYHHFVSPLFLTTLEKCLFLGLFYDVLSFFYFLSPFAFLLIFFPKSLFISSKLKSMFILSMSYFLFCYLLLFIAITEWFFWDEFHARFNFIAVDYLIYTRIVVQYIKEAYPVLSILLCIAIIALIISFFYLKHLIKLQNKIILIPHFFIRFLLFLLISCITFFIFFYMPDNLFVQKNNRYINEISKNGIFTFFKAYLYNELPFEQFYFNYNQNFLSKLLQQQLQISQKNKLVYNVSPLARTIVSNSAEKKYNVVLVVMESMSAQYLKPFQQRFGLTPNLDALAQKSLLFTNVYATGTRTVYGLSAITLSIPPIPGHAIIRRKHNENLFNLGSVFQDKGYTNKFIYGGYGYFDNMNYFFKNNGYQIIDRTKFKESEINFANVWGICDEDVFNRVLRENDNAYRRHQLFFDVIMTTSNHRPFTYPSHKVTIPSGSSREGGLQYADYAIGKFINQAKQHSWFNSTIFIFVADHTADNAGRNELSIAHYHIPLLFYAPKLIQPKIINTLSSQIDVAPTLLGLLEMSYHSQFFGHNILTAKHQRAFISNYQKIGYLTPTQLIVFQPGKQIQTYMRKKEQLYSISSHDFFSVLIALSYIQSATYWRQWNALSSFNSK